MPPTVQGAVAPASLFIRYYFHLLPVFPASPFGQRLLPTLLLHTCHSFISTRYCLTSLLIKARLSSQLWCVCVWGSRVVLLCVCVCVCKALALSLLISVIGHLVWCMKRKAEGRPRRRKRHCALIYASWIYANAAIVFSFSCMYLLCFTLPLCLSKRQMPMKMDIDMLRYVVMLGVISIQLRLDCQQQKSH